MDFLKNHVKIPSPNDKVYKYECFLSFDNPVSNSQRFFKSKPLFLCNLFNVCLIYFQETPSGLYVCLKSFLGFGVDYVGPYFQQTGNSVFLKIKRIKHKVNYINFIAKSI